MTDLLKEFNMTDLLGMLVPGSVVAFLVDKEYQVFATLSQLTGTEFSAVLSITLIIIAGYFIGMLVHEIGDCVEKLLWGYPGFNPRIYAAIRTAYLHDQGQKYNNSVAEQRTAGKMKVHWFDTMSRCVLGILTFAILLYELMNIFTVNIGGLGRIAAVVILTLVCSAICYLSCRSIQNYPQVGCNRDNANNTTSDKCKFVKFLYAAKTICEDNMPLSYGACIVDGKSDEYIKMILRKRDLFDGFRTSARNFLITFILVGIHATYTSGLTHSLRVRLIENQELVLLVGIAVILLAMRYIHFTYLRYKYCYEDFDAPTKINDK